MDAPAGSARWRAGGASAAAAVVIVAGATGVAGCIVRTDSVPAAFNQGVLDSGGDPSRDPRKRMESVVDRLISDEVVDGYFGQGPARGDGHRVSRWLGAAARKKEQFYQLTACYAYGWGRDCKLSDGGPGDLQRDMDRRIRDLTLSCMGDRPEAPICKGRDQPDWPAFERALDEVRFSQAISRAARAVGSVLAEGLVDQVAVEAGAKSAFERASTYIGARRWKRERGQPTTGLVVKGGAATGIFSAGVVWTALHVIDGCLSDPGCAARRAAARGCSGDGCDLGFQLLSGTSTGAMIAIAVDIFNAARTPAERKRGIADVAKWFTCYSLNDLYCVDSAPITSLFDDSGEALMGVLKFDGIERVLTSCVTDRMRTNRSELILNTVDFRSGRLYSLSDQWELSTNDAVVQAGLASALLPVIGRPVSKLPVFEPDEIETEAAFLDGGIRSEIPLLPLARRGAERVLVVSSSASVLNGTKRIRNALDIATRYIDVSTGGVSESELAHARRHAESIRFAEVAACEERLSTDRTLCPTDLGCDVRRICKTREWAAPCSLPPPLVPLPAPPAPEPESPPPPAPEVADAPREEPRLEAQAQAQALRGPPQILGPADPKNLSVFVEPFWQVQGIFRNEDRIDAISGYRFEPAELRRVFRAGAEAARLRCVDIAQLLGLDPALEPNLVRWCSPDLPPHAAVCGKMARPAQELRSCTEPPPDYLDACTQAPAPQPGVRR